MFARAVNKPLKSLTTNKNLSKFLFAGSTVDFQQKQVQQRTFVTEAMKMKAFAGFIERENEAKGILRLREAEAEGLSRLIVSAGNVDMLNSYLMVRDGQISQIAHHQSNAVQGMKPTITVVSGKDSNGLVDSVNQVVQTALPILNSLKNTTGIDFLKSYRQENK